MRFFLTHTITLILTACCCKNSYAVTDSLPSCIKNITTSPLNSFTEYDYKGQRLFSFITVAQSIEKETSDKMTTTRFYNSDCKLVCTWTKGGIAGLNKIIPENIEKEKIISIRIVTLNTVPKKKTSSVNLPDTIAKIAVKKNCSWIEETIYDGKLVFRFQNSLDKPSTSKITFVNPYCDENGNTVAVVKFMRRAFWWHNVNGNFSRTAFRPGYR